MTRSAVGSTTSSTDGCRANYPPLDSILGETTVDGILRVLEIPRELLP